MYQGPEDLLSTFRVSVDDQVLPLHVSVKSIHFENRRGDKYDTNLCLRDIQDIEMFKTVLKKTIHERPKQK